MTDTARDLEQVLTKYANRAYQARPDLAAVVEARYRRRVRHRAVAVMAAVLLVVGATVLSVSTLRGGGHTIGRPTGPATPSASHGAPTPTATPTHQGPFFVPPKMDPPRDIAAVWPRAIIHVPNATTPAAYVLLWPIDAVDATHVLMMGSNPGPPGELYVYDTVRKSFRKLGGPLQVTVDKIGWWAISPHWVVYGIQTESTIDVFRVPLGGGPSQHLAALPGIPIGPWFATDDAIYWSQADPGVFTVPMTGGEERPLPGFEDMRVVDSSGWAVGYTGGKNVNQPLLTSANGSYLTRSLRNLVTGDTVNVTAPGGAVRLQCAPAFCVGANDDSGGRIFIVRPDGSGQTWLDPRLAGGRLMMVGNTGLVTDYTSFFYDPKTGLTGGHGSWPRNPFDYSAQASVFRAGKLMAWSDDGAAYWAYVLLTRV